MTSVNLVGVAKVFPNGTRVLDGLDLHIETGELLVLLGPSGCGKSTILRLIAGLEAPTEGRILFDDEDTTDVPTRDRKVAMVAQLRAVPSTEMTRLTADTCLAVGPTPTGVLVTSRREAERVPARISVMPLGWARTNSTTPSATGLT